MTGVRALRTTTDRVVVGVLLLAAWQLASSVAGYYWVSPPWLTVKTLAALTASGEMPRHAGFTVAAALSGFALGGIPAVLLALWLRRHPLVQRVLDPFLVAGYGLPKLALAPLFILWLGIGISSKIVMAGSVVFFLLFFTVFAGVQAIDPKQVRMARVCGATDWQISRTIVWPAVVPHLFAGIRIATPYAIGGVVISELISSSRGLGYLVQLGATNFSTPDIFAAVVAITLLTGLGNWLVARAERRALKWRAGLQTQGGTEL
jgi:NitT/TauT family transport system permease protein